MTIMDKCSLCHEGAYRDKLVVFTARQGDRLIIVEDVPALVCAECGDQIFTEKAARGVERATAGEPSYFSPIYRFPTETA